MVNVDFADVRNVLRGAGTALMNIGQGQGRNRAQRAAEEALAGGFLNVSIRGAKRVLFNISGGEDLTLFEVNEIAEHIRRAIDATADITFGAVIDPSLQDAIRVTLIATEIEEALTSPHLQAARLNTSQQAPLPQSPRSQPDSNHPAMTSNVSAAVPPMPLK
jgi:cell division protein FtsZ